MLFFFLCCVRRKHEIMLIKLLGDLERDNQSSKVIDKTQYLFICCKQYSWKHCQISRGLGRATFRMAVLMASVRVHNIL